MNNIGKNIRTLRMSAGFTQDELAAALFVTRQTVSNYETGRSQPGIDMLIRIAEVLGTDANAVIYGTPNTQQKRRLAAGFIVYSALSVILIAAGIWLVPLAERVSELSYRTGPLWSANLILEPLIYIALGGWAVLAGELLLKMRTPGAKCAKWLRICAIVFLAVTALLLLPFLAGAVLNLMDTGYNINIPYIPCLYEASSAVMYAVWFAPMIYLLPGAALVLGRRRCIADTGTDSGGGQ